MIMLIGYRIQRFSLETVHTETKLDSAGHIFVYVFLCNDNNQRKRGYQVENRVERTWERIGQRGHESCWRKRKEENGMTIF